MTQELIRIAINFTELLAAMFFFYFGYKYAKIQSINKGLQKNILYLLDKAESRSDRNFINFLEIYILAFVLNTKADTKEDIEELIDMVEKTDFNRMKTQIIKILSDKIK